MSKLAITQMLCPPSKWNIKCPFEMRPQFITIHNTWNTASAMNEISYMIRNNHEVSFHYAVDENQAVQGLPLDRNGWHAGDGTYGRANRGSIGIEICRSRSDLTTYIEAEENGAILTALLLYKYNWDTDKVHFHFEFMNKHCPHRMLDEGRKGLFLAMVKKHLNELRKPKTQHHDHVDNGKVKLSPNAREYATGQLIPAWVKQQSFTIKEQKDNMVLLKEIYSWVWKRDLLGTKLKTDDQIANEVINGDWGNGAERKEKLQKAGYDYSKIQKIVNKKLG